MPITVSGGMVITGGLSTLDAPALSLDFMSGTLDSRITFSRGTQATMVDSTGRLTYAPNNIALWSTDFTQPSWQKFNSITATTTALTFVNSNSYVQQNLPGTYSVGQKFLFTFIASVPSGSVTIRSVIADSADGNPFYTQNQTITTTPTRFFQIATMDSNFGGTLAIQIQGGGLVTPGTVITFSGLACSLITYESAPRSNDLVATTSAAYYGPRFDYDPISLQPKGLLIEGQRTNLIAYSEQMDNAAWLKSGATVTANAITAPDGTTSADKIIASSPSGVVYQNITKAASAITYTGSCYLKQGEWNTVAFYLQGTVFANRIQLVVNLSTGSIIGAVTAFGTFTSPAASVTSVGNGWYRVTVTGTTGTETDISLNIYSGNGGTFPAGDGTSGIYAWGAQLEVGSFATSYIPTVASTVTRNADTMSMNGTNFSSWYNQSQGTFVISYLSPANPVQDIFGVNAGNFQNSIAAYYESSTQVLFARVSNVGQLTNNVISTLSQTSPVKLAIAYAANDYASCGNGGTVQTNSTSASVPTVDRLTFANLNIQGNPFNGYYRSFEYYNTRITNSQLQGMSRV